MSGFDSDLQVARGLVKTIQQNMSRRDRLRREGGSAGSLNGSKTRDQLAQLEKRLDAMERQLNQAARSPADYGVTPNEIDRRRGCLADVKRSKLELSRMLSGSGSYGSVSRDALLYSSNRPKQTDYSGRQFENENTREKDTREILRLQEQMMRRQDEGLGELEDAVVGLKHVGLAIGEGVDLTSALLDDVGRNVDRTDGALQKRTAKAKELQQQVSGNCCLYIIIILLVILTVINISTKGFTTVFK